MPAFAISEADVQAQVDSVGRETVTGNVLIWFLCAIGFLKAAQKIDSFMASLGVNVGHTGGSMLAEALIAARGVGTVAGAMGHSFGSGAGPKGSGGGAAASAGGFFKGGLIGMARRRATNEAVMSATSSTSAVRSKSATSTAESASHVSTAAASSKSATHEDHSSVTQTAHHESTGGKTATHTNQSTSAVTHTQRHAASTFQGIGLGGAIFAKSLMKGGDFANDVISTIARGDMRSTGSITGDLAAQSLRSYMGYTALGEGAKDAPAFSNVEIGGGRITGIETAPGSSEGVAFGMYLADQYTEPKGDFTQVHSADGSLWYKQYAQDAVERKPYHAPDGTVAFHESIIKRLPDPPARKERL
nr:hypothetical protein [Pseudoflavonifractor phocaeensis]